MKTRIVAAAVCTTCCIAGIVTCARLPMQTTAPHQPRGDVVVYSNDFNGPLGSNFPEWTSSRITYVKTVTGTSGSLLAPTVATVESPNRKQRFLGEFGGPPIGRAGEPDWNHTRVDQTVSLSLNDQAPHSRVTVAFDLYILKSWDGNSPRYGPDRFTLKVADGPMVLDTSFSNNPKVLAEGSYQSYPSANGVPANNPPQSGAASTGNLGYSNFFTDSVYHISRTFSHTASTLKLNFGSSLFEGKGTDDESWGLDNVVVTTGAATENAQEQPRP